MLEPLGPCHAACAPTGRPAWRRPRRFRGRGTRSPHSHGRETSAPDLFGSPPGLEQKLQGGSGQLRGVGRWVAGAWACHACGRGREVPGGSDHSAHAGACRMCTYILGAALGIDGSVCRRRQRGRPLVRAPYSGSWLAQLAAALPCPRRRVRLTRTDSMCRRWAVSAGGRSRARQLLDLGRHTSRVQE